MKIDINKVAEVLNSNGLTFNQLVVLSNLQQNPGIRGPQLAELSGASTVTMSQLTGKFLNSGLIKNTSTQKDRRIVEWTLTAKGEKLLEKVQEVHETKENKRAKKVEAPAAEVTA